MPDRFTVNRSASFIVEDVAKSFDLTFPQRDRLSMLLDQLVLDAVDCGRSEHAADLRKLLEEVV